jgi:hypothetical protein
MTAIEASSVRVSTLADGTLRLVVDIEPRHANAAFALFGSPGVAMALAALKPAAPEKPEKRERMGPLCEWAVYRCKEPQFQGLLSVESPEGARAAILEFCGIASRKELDTNPAAAALFKTHVMEPYAAWLKSQGTA